MTIPESPFNPDDTQPNRALSDRTTVPNRRAQMKGLMPAWMLIGLIVFSIASLTATLIFAMSRSNPPEESVAAVTVHLRVAGEQRVITTNALTVGDVLRDESVRVRAVDALAPSIDTPITTGMLITVDLAREVTLIVDDETQTLETPHENPADILRQALIDFDDSDDIWVDGSMANVAELEAWSVPANEIEIDHAYEITIIEGDTTISLITTVDTVGDALFEADTEVFLTDTISPDVSTIIDSDLTVTIDRARPITIHVDDTTIETRVQGATVADALAESGIALVGLDYTIPAEDSIITADTTINVLRVTESIETTDSTIAFETVYQADAAMNLDERQVVQAGQNGIERFSERVRFENGVEVSREPIGTEIIQTAQNQVVSYGTNIVIRTVDTPSGQREYWRVIRAYATSYHPEALGGDNITAIGMELEHGIIASNPNIIPYRTNLYVPGYGIGIMADTGGARSSPYWVDLGYSDADWVGWHQYVDVYLLTPVPADIDYLLPAYRPMNGIPDN